MSAVSVGFCMSLCTHVDLPNLQPQWNFAKCTGSNLTKIYIFISALICNWTPVMNISLEDVPTFLWTAQAVHDK
jgi:hypothetical protein